MVNLTLPAPKSGGLLITYKCNVRCKHCYLGCSKSKSGKMNPERAHIHLKEFYSAKVPQEEVHITGGEPFLNFRYLSDVLGSIKGTGYKNWGFVETNALWAANNNICERRLESIKRLGVEKLCISSDIFHQEFIPLENVKRLVDITHKLLGPDSVILRWPNGLKQEKHIGQMTSEEIESHLLNPLRDFRVRLVGRASIELKDYLPKKSADKYQCTPCFDKMIGTGHYHFDFKDNLIPGIGCIILGNSSRGDLQKLLGSVNERDNFIFSWLSAEGPSGRFLDYAKSKGYKELKEGYGDKCQLCFDIKRWLVQKGLSNFEIGSKEIYEY